MYIITCPNIDLYQKFNLKAKHFRNIVFVYVFTFGGAHFTPLPACFHDYVIPTHTLLKLKALINVCS